MLHSKVAITPPAPQVTPPTDDADFMHPPREENVVTLYLPDHGDHDCGSSNCVAVVRLRHPDILELLKRMKAVEALAATDPDLFCVFYRWPDGVYWHDLEELPERILRRLRPDEYAEERAENRVAETYVAEHYRPGPRPDPYEDSDSMVAVAPEWISFRLARAPDANETMEIPRGDLRGFARMTRPLESAAGPAA